MIQLRTMVTVADNSGAKRAQCIKVLGGHHKRYGRLGDIVVVSVKDAIPGAAVKKGDAMVILEAMKMELPLHAYADGTVSAVHCRAGDLVQPETVLVELT